MELKYFSIVFAALFPVLPMTAQAATWRVEKDGSGDYSIIQDAVDASAEGDTIQIGPGRYDDFFDFVAPAWTEPAVIGVTKNNLTFIGAGKDMTFVGPNQLFNPPGMCPMTVICVENYFGKFQDLSFENVNTGVYWAYGRVEVSDCSFIGSEHGIIVFNDGGGVIENSEFEMIYGMDNGVISFFPCRDLTVSNCRFGGSGKAISLNGTVNVSVYSCEFSSERAGVGIKGGSRGIMSNCQFSNNVGLGVWVSNNSILQLNNNQIYGSFSALYLETNSHVAGAENEFEGGADVSTIYASYGSSVTLHDCHIFKTGDYAFKTEFFAESFVEQDMTHNYWGATNPDILETWIWDANDDPGINSIVNYLPMANGPVPTEEKSFGSIKAMFR